ncbi:hypothetical protein Misp01_62580 [Microtetraspora sp. NBRC 13810]|uniref:hypothetical protein n=1 Tax=Microtetraspora sp. NBRC 13810 TaxID=3030990 RepID=UPI0024A10504|nr:hypothetical protein [Microtetraspora sp. NBRC 13810]GLW11130.1 hypothetical protein Misp01_62580 [Microtetraspora sp. NBRC 13810]
MGQIIEDPALDWGLRSPRRIVHWAAVAIVGVLVIGLGVWLAVRQAPAATPAPPANPAVSLAKPSGYHGEAGYPIGFPRTELGAASAATAALEAAWTLETADAEQAAVLYAPPEQQEAAREGANAAVQEWRAALGLPEEGDLPEGAALRTTPVGVQWTKRAGDQVLVSVLVQVDATKGTASDEPAYSSPYAMSLLMAWRTDIRDGSAGDWVNVPDPSPAAIPPVATPGTPEFRAAGWKPIAGPTS